MKTLSLTPFQSRNLIPKVKFSEFDTNSPSISVSVSNTKLIRMQSKIDTKTHWELISNSVNPLVKPPPIIPFQSGNLFLKVTILWSTSLI